MTRQDRLNDHCPLSVSPCGDTCHWYDSCPSSRLQSLTGPLSEPRGHIRPPRVLRRADRRAERLALCIESARVSLYVLGVAAVTVALGSLGFYLAR